MHSHPRLSTWPSRLVARPWLLALVPINAATACFSVALPLMILIPLHGSWASVALAATLFNAAVIVASLAWGYLADRFPDRRLFLLVNFGGFAAIYGALGVSHSLPALLGLYTVVGLLAPAGATAANLLILETFTESERANAYASFQEMSILGAMAGLLLGFGWFLLDRPFELLLLVLAALSAVSAIGVLIGVRNPARTRPHAAVAAHPESLASRIRHSVPLRISIPFFPRHPDVSPGGRRRFGRWVREELRHELPLILAASFLFNLTANLFNISYTPYLYSAGVGVASIFLINFGNNLTQGVAFPISGRLAGLRGADRMVHWSTYLRSVGYLAVVGFALVHLPTAPSLGLNTVAYAVLGGSIAFYSTASSLILFRALHRRDAGRILGINSALGGLAAVGGGVAAGALSLVGSYSLTFLVAGVGLLASLPLWTAAHLAGEGRRTAAEAKEHAAPTGRATAAQA
jgi:MFS family permease